jgi:hypothetical protein
MENKSKSDHFNLLPENSLSSFLDYSGKRTDMLQTLTKSELKTVTRHCGLNHHMHRSGKCHEDTCRLCMEESEIAQHILCECPATARIRVKRWGEDFLIPTPVKRLNPKSILGYFKDIQLSII